jgi:hypothetical protein
MDQHAELFTDLSVTDFEAGSVPPLPPVATEEPDEEARPSRPPPKRTVERQR